ncbi:hypothetical protein H072_10106 [Dactylellina haptotyla CBS 200.50]|uniref:IgE-binding protein n=1 Tax=Dactylellina haptotyla (strain CBS 200.50) TaxID=1284197 RepID=S8A102_DACHA|nr:hypothetical protein H072_10106 [Dactylellina haptotyla CBS 200.50]
MKFTLATVITAASVVSAAPTYSSEPKPLALTMMAIRSASPIHFGRVDASGQKFYIGLDRPSSYCPSPPVPVGSCPSGNYTSISWGQYGPYMNVEVPGGQQIYIAPDNSLSYTQAHSGSMPPGSTTDGFTLGPKQENTLRHIDHKSGGFLACPAKKDVGPWKVFVGSVTDKNAPSGSAADCLGFLNTGIEFIGEQFGAWQY